MRLINTKTLKLEDFISDDNLEYAILSHRWGPNQEEVSFEDMFCPEKAQTKHGFRKITSLCQKAANEGLQYAWVDTCCIDKKSSAELSEAINSMFRWYERSTICYVYLADVCVEDDLSAFVRSDWFRRGWTLQELLAPKRVVFYDKNWQKLGWKSDFVESIQKATGISRDAITGFRPLQSFSVAERMSWAADRVTTRIEDRSYSLFGIFDVNMPLLYGEGAKAFTRLQEQIVRNSDDYSLFAWTSPIQTDSYSGLLANSPTDFKFHQKYFPLSFARINMRSQYAVTNRGISITLRLWPMQRATYAAWIEVEASRSLKGFLISLRKVDNSEPGQYVRMILASGNLRDEITRRVTLAANGIAFERPSIIETIYVLQRKSWPRDDIFLHSRKRIEDEFRVQCFTDTTSFRVTDVDEVTEWNAAEQVLRMNPKHIGTAGIFTFNSSTDDPHAKSTIPRKMLLGIDFNFLPVCIIATEVGLQNLSLRQNRRESTTHPEDISRTSFKDITCFETKGWSKVRDPWHRYDLPASEVDGVPGMWAFRMKSPIFGLCELIGDEGWLVSVTLREHEHYKDWQVALGNTPEFRKMAQDWRWEGQDGRRNSRRLSNAPI